MRSRTKTLSELILVFEAYRELIDERFEALENRIAFERSLLSKATEEKADEIERRLEGLNQLRNEVIVDRSQFITRDIFAVSSERLNNAVTREYYDQQYKSLGDKVDVNTATISNMRSRSAAYTAAIGIAIVVLTAVIAVIQLIK